jgi:hypothetical protein
MHRAQVLLYEHHYSFLKTESERQGKTISGLRNVSIVLRHFFLKITVEAFPPPVAPACVLLGRQAY